ncbi:MAG: hypothetical protein AAB815_02955, partial [Patescibacteria group bacterium]
MLLPKKVKFRKWQTGRANPKKISADTRGTKLSFGSYGLKAESQARVDFVDPLFEALGWDVRNAAGRGPTEREVIVESGRTLGRPLCPVSGERSSA